MADEDLPPCGTGGTAGFRGSEAAQVRRTWSEWGLPGLVDVHTHFMPKSVMDMSRPRFAPGPASSRQRDHAFPAIASAAAT